MMQPNLGEPLLHAEEYSNENLSVELRLEYLALGDLDERIFRMQFMNITNDTSDENNPGNAYKSIEWAIDQIKKLDGIETIEIGQEGRKKAEMIINRDKKTALYPYSIAKESKYHQNLNFPR